MESLKEVRAGRRRRLFLLSVSFFVFLLSATTVSFAGVAQRMSVDIVRLADLPSVIDSLYAAVYGKVESLLLTIGSFSMEVDGESWMILGHSLILICMLILFVHFPKMRSK